MAYSEYIQNRRGWEYAGVYADEMRTGTKDDRPEFQKLIADCQAGNIDMVITKSISRFARNTVIMLKTVRLLKSLGVDVFFERENIHSMSNDGELILTILASFAQEESRSVSENCKWRIRSKFMDGITNNDGTMGYKLVNGTFVIVPGEAEIVKMIFTDFLSGMGKNAIVKKLISLGVPTKRGGQWCENAIYKMLRNEKYMGDMLLQKTFVTDHISKKKAVNAGELPQYYVENSHEAIIDRDTFRRVQDELTHRAALYPETKKPPEVYPFTGRIVCGQCGKTYRRKIANAATPYERAVWICGTFNRLGKAVCSSKQIPEETLMTFAAEVLALAAFDETVFKNKISEIRIPSDNCLVFIFSDGTVVTREWQRKPRSASWTDEKRKQASERRFEYLLGVDN